jgi:hypothetical protein
VPIRRQQSGVLRHLRETFQKCLAACNGSLLKKRFGRLASVPQQWVFALSDAELESGGDLQPNEPDGGWFRYWWLCDQWVHLAR